MSRWFLCKVSMPVNGEVVKENYLIDAVNFIDAETRLTKNLELMHSDIFVETITPQKISDIFFFTDAETFYKAKVEYVATDEKAGKEKLISHTMIVQADTIKQALARLMTNLETSVVSWEIAAIEKTNLIEAYPYQLKAFAPKEAEEAEV